MLREVWDENLINLRHLTWLLNQLIKHFTENTHYSSCENTCGKTSKHVKYILISTSSSSHLPRSACVTAGDGFCFVSLHRIYIYICVCGGG